MALLRGSLPLVSFLVFFISCAEGMFQPVCYRVFPLQLTANAMPCRYICAYYIGHTPHYHVRGEDDGTFCREGGREGVCWSGTCLTRYGQGDDWSQHVDAASKVPLRIRKRDVVSTVKGVTNTKTLESDNGSSLTTKTVKTVSTTKTTADAGDSDSAGVKGFKGSFTRSFSADQTSQGTKTSLPQVPSLDVDTFSMKGSPSTIQTTQRFYSNGVATPTVKNRGVTVTVRHGPNGQKITTKTVRRLIITHGPRKTVRRIVFRQGPFVSGSNLMLGGRNAVTTKTITVRHGPLRGSIGLMAGGNADMSRKTSQITLHTTTGVQRNPIASIVHKTVQQQRVLGGHNAGGASTATKTVSTVAVTKTVQPSLAVVKVTKPNVTPSTAASMATSNTATVRGLEVEVPGYTAGLRHQWKWVLARRVGVYPPYVQVLDPEVLYYKLGLQNPNLPSLPGPVQDILNRVPVHPVGSDIYGFLLSSRILERIRGFTERLNGLTNLRSMLSSSNTSNQDNSNILNSLLAGTESSPSGSALLQKLIIASLSRLGSTPLISPYAGYLSGSNGGLFGRRYGNPWAPFPGGPFPAGQWPFHNNARSPLGRFGRTASLYSSDISGSSTGEQPMFPEDENLAPSVEVPAPESPESLLGGSSDTKSLLESIVTRGRHVQPLVESPISESEKLARALGEEKLRYLLKTRNGRSSLIRSMNEALHSRNYINVLSTLRKLGVRPKSRVYNTIVREILSSRKHRNLRSNQAQDVISMLLERTRKNDDDTTRYLPTLSSSGPRSLEPLESRTNGHHVSRDELIELLENTQRRESTNEYGPLARILLAERPRHHPTPSGDKFDSSRKEELIEALIDLSKREPSSYRTSDLRKRITKALLRSSEGPVSPHGTKARHLSKLVSVQSATHTEARPQGLTHSNVYSTAYQTSRGDVPAPMPILSAPVLPLGPTSPLTQPSQMLGISEASTVTRSQPFLQPYPQFVTQTYIPNGGSRVSEQSTLFNRQFVAPTEGVYNSPQAQSAATMMSGTGAYSHYATVPTSTAYMSQYATQPYYLGTSLYGGHPHYVVEGHEAPGTRWQLRVWRHHPGVSYVAPGFSGFQSSHLGSVVARARETVTNGLQYGSHPGQFGFTTYGSSIPGGSISAASSQYVVKTPDGSLVLNRQPLSYGSLAQGAPTSRVVVSQTKTTKTVTGTTVPTVSGGLSSASIQSTVEGGSSAGTTKSESLSEMSQTKESDLFSSASSNGDSQNKESLFSSSGDSSSSVKSNSDLSQSKLLR